MILHLVFSAVSCSPELFLIFRMSVERKKKSKKSTRQRREIFALSPRNFSKKSISKEEKKKKMNRVHLETKNTHPQSATPAETPSGPVAPPASARARSALSSPSFIFLMRVCFFFFSREMCVCVCSQRDFFYEEESEISKKKFCDDANFFGFLRLTQRATSQTR